ncbi:DoxX family protein [Brevibacillus nitrificans]|uniref:DoxX family protein n=1 Tax=Brevibacillus nitrificans TaxID=651560 RepID=UPI002E1B4B07|nr:DoxX family protein [Brevibacillus nitrificans]
MVPFYVLVGAFLLFKILGLIGLPYFQGWHTSLQGAVAVMLLLTASAHWGAKRPDLIRMVPSIFPKPDWIVTATGLLEIAGAIGILFPATSQVTSIGLAVLLVAMFPANVRAARESLTIGGRPVPKLPLRTVLQVVFLAAVLLAG